MGKTKLIPLIVRETKSKKFLHAWQTKYAGRPTPENLSKDRDVFNKSLLKGGCNEHVGIIAWCQCEIEIYDQRKKQVICTFNPPMFEVIP